MRNVAEFIVTRNKAYVYRLLTDVIQGNPIGYRPRPYGENPDIISAVCVRRARLDRSFRSETSPPRCTSPVVEGAS